LFISTTSWVRIERLNGLVVKPKIFDTTEVVFTTDTIVGLNDYGRGDMFGGIGKTSLDRNT
jgi:hypothetical protein